MTTARKYHPITGPGPASVGRSGPGSGEADTQWNVRLSRTLDPGTASSGSGSRHVVLAVGGGMIRETQN